MNGPNHATHLNDPNTERASMCNDETVLAAQAGSPGAFAELYATYSPRLYRTILRITKSPEDSEDALQETFMHACLAIHNFEGRSRVSSWLTRIAINSALAVLRKRRVRAEILFDHQPDDRTERFCVELKDPAPDPEQIFDLLQRRVRLQQTIRNMNACLREPIRMRIANDASVKEISRSLNISEATAKTRLHRARMQLSTKWLKSR